ncbi:uncharacterized protein LOC121856539 isoform X2 [Homarus americanus]|uniref:uncharacterized protein LOC121856539 isoform X2 n=1 Tax=Homarus americanus TaxID=6706 RepID=UPI001C482810|nr:uncharacterized protein LOC121856539 isoform X2 [Homarus americanus]
MSLLLLLVQSSGNTVSSLMFTFTNSWRARLNLITSIVMDQQLQRSTRNPRDDIFSFYNTKSITPRRKKENMEKFRHIMEEIHGQQRNSLQKSNSKLSAKKEIGSHAKPTSLRVSPRFSQKKGPILSRNPQEARRHLGIVQSSQECCRTLQFESGDEGDGPEDHTEPLNMMDMTTVISEASILQAPYHQQQPKKIPEPVIKKSLLNLADTSSGMRKTGYNLRNKKLPNYICQSRVHSEEERKVIFKTGIIDDEAKTSHSSIETVESKEAVNESSNEHTSTISPKKLNKEDKTNNASWNVNEKFSKKVSFSEQKRSARKIPRRRSAIALRVRTPTYKNNKNPRRRSASKLPKPSDVQPIIGKPVQRPSDRYKRNVTHVDTETPLQEPGKENMTSTCIQKVDTCDAATNTQIKFIIGQSSAPQLTTEIENLLKEQDEINKKANLLMKQSHTRRQQMKESGVMESFMASLSPLKRIRMMLQNKEDYATESNDSLTPKGLENDFAMDETIISHGTSVFSAACCDDTNTKAGGSVTQDSSVLESSILNTTNYLNASQSYWNLMKHDNRFLRTPSSVPAKKFINQTPVQIEEEDEQFENEKPWDKSTFTELAGNCERPSLAPMTPHSRQQVSQLKLCLRKQLEDLYD